MSEWDLGWWGVLVAVIGGAIRISTPYLFVSLGETLTEKSGRVNLGLEGTLVMGAMSGFAVSYITGSPWLGVLAAGLAGAALGLLHGAICSLPRVNDIGVGIALFLFGTGLAMFLGKPFIQPRGPRLPSLELGALERAPGGARGTRDQCAVPGRHGACAGALLGPAPYTLGARAAHGRRQRRRRACARLFDRPGTHPRHHGGRVSRRDRRVFSVTLLSGQLERGAVQRSGLDGGGACHLCALESAAPASGYRFSSAVLPRSGRRCSRSASRKDIICSMQPLTSSP